jgi:hypothetical protein
VRERSPHLPIWLGGYADGALRRARRMAHGHPVGRGDLPLVQRAVTLLGPPDDRFTVAVNLVTAPDGAARAAFERQQRTYEELQRADNPYAGAVDAAQVHLHGDPDAIVAAALRYRTALGPWPRVHLVLRALFPEADVDAQVQRLGALGRDVLPALRTAW